MTGDPLKVDTEELIQLANGHEQLVEVLSSGTGPPQIKVLQDFPDMAAAQAALGAQRAAKAAQAAQLSGTATNLRANAGAMQGQENASKSILKQEVGLGELGQFAGGFLQPLSQMGSSFVAAIAQVAGAGFGVVGGLGQGAEGLMGAVTSAGINHKPDKPEAAAGPPGPHSEDGVPSDRPDPKPFHQTTPIQPTHHQGR